METAVRPVQNNGVPSACPRWGSAEKVERFFTMRGL